MRRTLLFFPVILISLILGISFYAVFQRLSHSETLKPAIIPVSTPADVTPNDVVQMMIGQVDQERALTDLRKLTGDEPVCLEKGCYTIADRVTGSTGLQWAKEYISEELTNLGYFVTIQDWSRSGYSDQNLIVRKAGIITPGEEIYFVAHMDGVAGSPAADDDASGVVSLLQVARILRSFSLHSTVVLLFSTGEEQGALGANSYVDQLSVEQLEAISYVINVDTIAYDANDDGVMELWNGTQPLDFVELLSGILSAYPNDLTVQIVSDCG